MKSPTTAEHKTHAMEIEAQTGHLLQIKALRTEAQALEKRLAPYSTHFFTDVLADLDAQYDKALHLVSRAICLAMGEGEPIHEAVKQALFEWHRLADGCVPRLHDALVGHYGPSEFDRLPSLIEDVLDDEELRSEAIFRRLAKLGVPIDDSGVLPLDYMLVRGEGWGLLSDITGEPDSEAHDWIAMWLSRRARASCAFVDGGLAKGLAQTLRGSLTSLDVRIDLAGQGIETSTPDGVTLCIQGLDGWKLQPNDFSWRLTTDEGVVDGEGAIGEALAKAMGERALEDEVRELLAITNGLELTAKLIGRWPGLDIQHVTPRSLRVGGVHFALDGDGAGWCRPGVDLDADTGAVCSEMVREIREVL